MSTPESGGGGLGCVYCLLTSGGGTKTPAVMVVNGQSLCERHVQEAVDALRPEVDNTLPT